MTLHETSDDAALISGFDAEVEALVRRVARSAIPPGATVLYGASSVRMWEDFVERFRPHNVVRLGFGGATLPALCHHFPRLVAPLRPGHLLIWPGSNDIGNFGATAVQAADRMLRLIDKARQHLPDMPITFMSVFAPPGRVFLMDEIHAANDLMRRAVSAIAGVGYLDTSSIMLGANGRPLGQVFADDRIHLNAAGYDRVETIMRNKSGPLDRA